MFDFIGLSPGTEWNNPQLLLLWGISDPRIADLCCACFAKLMSLDIWEYLRVNPLRYWDDC